MLALGEAQSRTLEAALLLCLALVVGNLKNCFAQDRFPDFRDPPPNEWTGPVFLLKQNYSEKPVSRENYPWKRYDPKTQWPEHDWVLQKNPIGSWYHAPWLHWGRNGREFIRS